MFPLLSRRGFEIRTWKTDRAACESRALGDAKSGFPCVARRRRVDHQYRNDRGMRCPVPLQEKTNVQKPPGTFVNMTYYPATDLVAGIEIEIIHLDQRARPSPPISGSHARAPPRGELPGFGD